MALMLSKVLPKTFQKTGILPSLPSSFGSLACRSTSVRMGVEGLWFWFCRSDRFWATTAPPWDWPGGDARAVGDDSVAADGGQEQPRGRVLGAAKARNRKRR